MVLTFKLFKSDLTQERVTKKREKSGRYRLVIVSKELFVGSFQKTFVSLATTKGWCPSWFKWMFKDKVMGRENSASAISPILFLFCLRNFLCLNYLVFHLCLADQDIYFS